MTLTRQAKGPGGESEAHHNVLADTPILPETAHNGAAHAAAIPGYVVVVQVRDDRVRRFVYLSLHSAIAATERARSRGQESSVTLCELRPTEAVIA